MLGFVNERKRSSPCQHIHMVRNGRASDAISSEIVNKRWIFPPHITKPHNSQPKVAMDTQTIGFIHNKDAPLVPKAEGKTFGSGNPQLHIARHPGAKSGLESLRLALFLFSFLRICYWPLSLLDSLHQRE